MLKPVISADSHVTEPPGCYGGRIDHRFRDRAPHMVNGPKFGDAYVVEGLPQPLPLNL